MRCFHRKQKGEKKTVPDGYTRLRNKKGKSVTKKSKAVPVALQSPYHKREIQREGGRVKDRRGDHYNEIRIVVAFLGQKT